MKIRLLILVMLFALLNTQRSFESLENEVLSKQRPYLSADSIDFEDSEGSQGGKMNKRNGEQGLRLSLTNNIDILRERLFNAISSNRVTEKEDPEESEETSDSGPPTKMNDKKMFLLNLARAKAKLNRLGRENSGVPLYLIRSNALDNSWRKRMSPFTFRAGRRGVF